MLFRHFHKDKYRGTIRLQSIIPNLVEVKPIFTDIINFCRAYAAIQARTEIECLQTFFNHCVEV